MAGLLDAANNPLNYDPAEMDIINSLTGLAGRVRDVGGKALDQFESFIQTTSAYNQIILREAIDVRIKIYKLISLIVWLGERIEDLEEQLRAAIANQNDPAAAQDRLDEIKALQEQINRLTNQKRDLLQRIENHVREISAIISESEGRLNDPRVANALATLQDEIQEIYDHLKDANNAVYPQYDDAPTYDQLDGPPAGPPRRQPLPNVGPVGPYGGGGRPIGGGVGGGGVNAAGGGGSGSRSVSMALNQLPQSTPASANAGNSEAMDQYFSASESDNDSDSDSDSPRGGGGVSSRGLRANPLTSQLQNSMEAVQKLPPRFAQGNAPGQEVSPAGDKFQLAQTEAQKNALLQQNANMPRKTVVGPRQVNVNVPPRRPVGGGGAVVGGGASSPPPSGLSGNQGSTASKGFASFYINPTTSSTAEVAAAAVKDQANAASGKQSGGRRRQKTIKSGRSKRGGYKATYKIPHNSNRHRRHRHTIRRPSSSRSSKSSRRTRSSNSSNTSDSYRHTRL
jgi:hypothetical protein